MADKTVVPFPVVLRRFVPREHLTIPRRPWLMRGLLMRGHVTTLLAAGGVGKSNFGLTIGLHMCAGKPFGPWASVGKLKVAVLSVEEDEAELDRRLHAILDRFGIPREDAFNLFIVQTAGEPLLAVANGKGEVRATKVAEELELLAFREGIDLVIIDPFVEVWLGQENDNTQVRQAAGIIRQMIRRINASCLLMHHVKKGQVEPGDIDAGRGASSLGGLARFGFTLTNMTQDDAKALNLDSHKGFVRADAAKGNYVAPSDKTDWFRFEEIRLRNGDPLKNEIGDGVGVLVPWSAERAGSGLGRAEKVERVFLKLLQKAEKRKIQLSDLPASPNFAPKIFVDDKAREGCNRREFEDVMERLLESEQITIEVLFPGTTRQKRVLRSAAGG
jgi:RecA-family ATPase